MRLTMEQMNRAYVLFGEIERLTETREQLPSAPVLQASVGPTREHPLAPCVAGVPVPREVVVAQINRSIEECRGRLAALGLAFQYEE